MSTPRKVYTSLPLDRDDGEIIVALEGTYMPAHRGVRAHPMDRFAPPDDPAEMVDITASRDGVEIELTEREAEQAHDALIDAVNSQSEPNEP